MKSKSEKIEGEGERETFQDQVKERKEETNAGGTRRTSIWRH